jgi:uncharacterized damage-inducible protein DinB
VNAQLAGAWAQVEEMYGELIELVERLDEVAANWRPSAPESNSIAALVRHTIGSNGMWCSIALDEPFERDRDAEFRVQERPETLVAALRDSFASVHERFERLDGVDLAVERRDPRPGGEVYTAGWCVAHVVAHMSEHWGQIQLTRDLYRAGGSGGSTASKASVVRTPEEEGSGGSTASKASVVRTPEEEGSGGSTATEEGA